jgi:hypothetical protein
MLYAQLREQGVDRPDLDSLGAASVPELGGLDVVMPIGGEHRQRVEVPDDLTAVTRTRQSLQDLLEYEACRDYLASREFAPQFLNLRQLGRRVSTKRERPDAGVDEDRHLRERSFL